MPFAALVEQAMKGSSNAYSIGFSTGLDPDSAIRSFLPGSFFNLFPYDNPAVTALILEARRSSDLDFRGALYRRITPLIMEDSPFIFFTGISRFVSSRVQGCHLGVRATATTQSTGCRLRRWPWRSMARASGPRERLAAASGTASSQECLDSRQCGG